MRHHEKWVNRQREKKGLPPLAPFLSPENIAKACADAQEMIAGKSTQEEKERGG